MSIIPPTNLVILERWQRMQTMVRTAAAEADDYIDNDYNSAGPVVVVVSLLFTVFVVVVDMKICCRKK